MSAVKKLTPLAPETRTQKTETEYNWRVLIVEDEPAIAEGIKAIIAPPSNVVPITRSSRQRSTANTGGTVTHEIRRDQFEVVWAKNPTEALQLVSKAQQTGKPFAMGFFDVLLGADTDGIELVRQIHLIDPQIYAVFVTAYHDRTVDSINQILGPDKSDRWDYMNKPFSDGAILQKARNAVSTWNLREQKRVQDEKLAEASNLLLQNERSNTVAAVGRSVAHEFGNLLMRIMGNAEVALMKGDLQNMNQSLKTILKAGETAVSVLSKFKKLQHGENGLDYQVISVNQCLDEAVDLMGHEFRKRNIKVTRIKYDKCDVEANYHSLIQVFMNVFINSSHAMPDAGQIDLSVVKIMTPDGTEPEWVELRLRDHGPGIDESILPFVMDPFYTTKGQQGTGLGLPICCEIIETEHHGEFTIRNHPSKGIEILIRLPVKQEKTDGV